MVIVAGHRIVDPPQRESYMADCVGVVEQARRAPGCLDFSIAADLVVPGRINILRRTNDVRTQTAELTALEPALAANLGGTGRSLE